MSKEKEIEGEAESEDMCSSDCCLGGKKGLPAEDSREMFWVGARESVPEKIRLYEANWKSNPNQDVISSGQGSHGGSSGVESQDADYSYVPSLSYEVEVLILARIPRSEYWKLSFVNKRFLALLKSGELFKVRREIGLKEPSVFMLASGESSWWAFDRQFKSRRKLPVLPSDICFSSGDKESFCAGTDVFVSGNEIDGVVLWRYELATNSWFKGPSMRNARCLFASATCGTFAYIAGGIGMETDKGVLKSAEMYDSDCKSWVPLPRMHKRRKLCSGCFMDNKFYVIGGQDEEGNNLTCGEAFDVERSTWELISDMLRDIPVAISQSPPLVAVVNNQLYSLEAASNELKVYLKKSNTWKRLGPVPVRADFNKGWGVAFKSLGDELLVIGASAAHVAAHVMSIYTCCPDPDADELLWRPLEPGSNRLSHFILNCSIMFA